MSVTIYGQSEELVSRCVECDLAEPESLASLGGSAPGLVDGILSNTLQEILHILKENYKIKINPHVYQGSDFPYDPGGTMIC